MSPQEVAALAALLEEMPDVTQGYRHCARWLLTRGVRVESPPPAGPWSTRWMDVVREKPLREVRGLQTDAEALAVRDALNALGASKGTNQ